MDQYVLIAINIGLTIMGAGLLAIHEVRTKKLIALERESYEKQLHAELENKIKALIKEGTLAEREHTTLVFAKAAEVAEMRAQVNQLVTNGEKMEKKLDDIRDILMDFKRMR